MMEKKIFLGGLTVNLPATICPPGERLETLTIKMVGEGEIEIYPFCRPIGEARLRREELEKAVEEMPLEEKAEATEAEEE
jgi:hypothetical protein